MKSKAVLALAILAVSLSVSSVGRAQDLATKTIGVSDEDAEMNAAIEKARSTLPKFWASFAKPDADEDYFSLKIRISDGQNGEHFWCDQIQGDEKASTCAIANPPQFVFTVNEGQRISVISADISDWMILKKGKLIGGATIRVLLPRMDKSEAESVRAMLADE